jgi:hypothetical protein
MADDELLFEGHLVPDADALREMSVANTDVLIDPPNLSGARILIVKRLESVSIADGSGSGSGSGGGSGSGDGAFVRLVCSFLPAPGTRFVSARVSMKLIQPQGAMFLDIAPREIKQPVKVEYSREASAKLSVKFGPVTFDPSGKADVKLDYDAFICLVRGVGANSVRAIWDFEEDPGLERGIGVDQPLAVIVPAGQKVKAELLVTAQLARNGALGALDMMLGRRTGAEKPEVTLYEP